MAMKTRDIFLIEKSAIAFWLFVIGILWAYFGSLNPWFMWGVIKFNSIIPTIFILLSMYVSSYFLGKGIFDREESSIPAFLALLSLVLMRIVNGNNAIGITEAILTAFIIFSVLRLNNDYLERLMRIICIIMGGFMCVSVAGFLLFLFGFPLPSSSIMNEELHYSFQNYYIFLIDDRAFFALFPRFHSVFLEPGHLGTATAFLLFTQIGHWKKWYNIMLFVTTFLTFSLAAYVLLIMVLFAAAWIQHKQFFLKILAIIFLIISVGVGAFLYDQGDNMLFTMIVERLEMTEDGSIAGDNRVTEDFEAVYDDYVQSSDIWFGREYSIEDFGFGNAGYRVFLYDYGLICLVLVLLFYISSVMFSPDKRAVISVLVIAIAAFMVRATPFSFYFLLPLYALPYIRPEDSSPLES